MLYALPFLQSQANQAVGLVNHKEWDVQQASVKVQVLYIINIAKANLGGYYFSIRNGIMFIATTFTKPIRRGGRFQA